MLRDKRPKLSRAGSLIEAWKAGVSVVTVAYRLRDAGPEDRPFAERLYLETMEPLLSKLGEWDAPRFAERLRALYEPEESKLIFVDGCKVGWMQVRENGDDISLMQLHLLEPYRNRGIGTDLVKKLIEHARKANKRLSLSSPRNNRALELYRRLGFVANNDDGGSIIDMVRAPEGK